MAIDMLENNDLGALSESRLGNKCFVNDDSFSNFSFRRKKYFRKIREQQQAVNAQFAVDENTSKDCDALSQKLQVIKNEIQGVLSSNPNRAIREAKLKPLVQNETIIKNLLLTNKCEEKQSQAEEEKFKKETEEAIQRASESSPAIPDVNVAKGSKTTKIILVAVGLVVVGVVGVALFRKK